MYACVWSDPTKRTDFEKNPKKAIMGKFPGIVASDTVLDLSWPYDPVATWLKDKASTDELLNVVKTGSTSSGQKLSAPVFTFQGWSTPLPQGGDPAAISLENWTRIYAYIWYQSKTGNSTPKGNFEKDPFSALPPIVADLKNPPYSVTITYTKLLNLGPPPTIFPPDTLMSICNDADAKKYRHKPNLCC